MIRKLIEGSIVRISYKLQKDGLFKTIQLVLKNVCPRGCKW